MPILFLLGDLMRRARRAGSGLARAARRAQERRARAPRRGGDRRESGRRASDSLAMPFEEAANLHEHWEMLSEQSRLRREAAPKIESRGLLSRPDGFYGVRWQMLVALRCLERGDCLLVASRTCSMGVWLPGCPHPYLLHEALIGEGLVEPVPAELAHWAAGIEAYRISETGRSCLADGQAWLAAQGPFARMRLRLFE